MDGRVERDQTGRRGRMEGKSDREKYMNVSDSHPVMSNSL